MNEGEEAFRSQIDSLNVGKKRRGLPKDAYEVFRVTWKKSNKFERKYSETITEAAKKQNRTEPEYIKMFLIKHMKEIEADIKKSK